jgi:hypothetical protein
MLAGDRGRPSLDMQNIEGCTIVHYAELCSKLPDDCCFRHQSPCDYPQPEREA